VCQRGQDNHRNPSNIVTSEDSATSHWTDVQRTNFVDSCVYHKPTPRFHRSEFNVLRQIGEGGQGRIYEVVLNKSDGDQIRPYVMKVFKSAVGSPQGQWPDKLLEIDSAHTCDLIGYVDQGEGAIGLLMQCYHLDLRQLIEKRVQSGRVLPFTVYESMAFIVCIALGMKVLHKHGVVHKDLKASNIFLRQVEGGNSRDMVIADFENSSDVVGTRFWRAPEILQALKDRKKEMVSTIYTSKSDVYSFGMLCYEILTGLIPLAEYPASNYDVVLVEMQRPTIPSDVYPKKLVELICQCWQHDPNRRPTSLEIVLHLRRIVEEDKYLSHILVHLILDEVQEDTESPSNPLTYLDDLQDKFLSLQTFMTPKGYVASCNYISEVRQFAHQFSSGLHVENSKHAFAMIQSISDHAYIVQQYILAKLWWDGVPRPMTLHVLKLLFQSCDWALRVRRLYTKRIPSVVFNS